MTTQEKSVIKFGDLEIFYKKRIDNKLPPTLNELLVASDLKPGVYEGGFKIWECSIDLCRYLIAERNRLENKRVLELGCGAGLPGIVAMKQDAKHVCFQDFNEEVIAMWTNVNVNLNLDISKNADSLCSFLAGDWDQTRATISSSAEKFDVVLTSETIYNSDNYSKLLATIDAALSSSGCALVAAKAYYFGVGGSVDSFLEFVNEDKTFSAQVVWSSDSAINRQILLLRRI